MIEAPFLIPAGEELGVSVTTILLSYAYGDSTTEPDPTLLGDTDIVIDADAVRGRGGLLVTGGSGLLLLQRDRHAPDPDPALGAAVCHPRFRGVGGLTVRRFVQLSYGIWRLIVVPGPGRDSDEATRSEPYCDWKPEIGKASRHFKDYPDYIPHLRGRPEPTWPNMRVETFDQFSCPD